MPAAARKVTRTPKTPEKSTPRALGFRQRLIEFLSNKAMIETLTARNQGEGRGEDKAPGLRDYLLDFVVEHGERDPETGSFFLDLAKHGGPITTDLTGGVTKKLKAERRVSKALDAAKTLALAEKLHVRDKIEEFQYVLRLTSEQAETFASMLKDAGLVDRVVSTDAVVVEDNLLQIHYGRDPHTAGPLLGKDKKPLISEKTLDDLYVENESFAFKPLAK